MKRLVRLALVIVCVLTFPVRANPAVDEMTISLPGGSDSRYEVQLSGASPVRMLISNAGTTFHVGNTILYFDGLGRREAEWVYSSFIRGGVIYPLIGTLGDGLMKTSFFRANRIMNWAFYLAKGYSFVYSELYTYLNIYKIMKAGKWYSLPSLLMTLDLPKEIYRRTGMTYRQFHMYGLAAGLKGTEELSGALTQLRSETATQYIHVPFTGSAGKHFVVKALFQQDGFRPTYELNLITSEALDNSQSASGDMGSYQTLAHTLLRQKIDTIYLQPDEQKPEELVAVFYDPESRGTVRVTLQNDQNTHSVAPWLLHLMYRKKDRHGIDAARSALSPSIIGAVSDALEAYFEQAACEADTSTAECFHIQKTAQGEYLYNVDGGFGQTASVQHLDSTSLFTFEAEKGDEPVGVSWADGTFWSGMEVKGSDSDDKVSQWLFPEWFSHFLIAEMAYRSREAAKGFIQSSARRIGLAAGIPGYVEEERTRQLWIAYRHAAAQIAREARTLPEPAEGTGWMRLFSNWVVKPTQVSVDTEFPNHTPGSGENKECGICFGPDGKEGMVSWLGGEREDGTQIAQPFHRSCLENWGVELSKQHLRGIVNNMVNGKGPTFTMESPGKHSTQRATVRVTQWGKARLLQR